MEIVNQMKDNRKYIGVKLGDIQIGGKRSLDFLKLLYWSEKQWHPLPEWALFFINVGIAIGTEEAGIRKVLAITVPNRAFISSLISLGVVIAGQARPLKNEKEEYLEKIKGLPKDTSIYARSSSKNDQYSIISGIVDGTQAEYGKQLLPKVAYYSKREKNHIWMYPEFIFRISISEQLHINLIEKRLKNVKFNSSFISRIYNVQHFILESYIHCTIFGNMSVIEEEVTQTSFGIKKNEGGYVHGDLQDLLRIKNILSDGESYHTNLYSSSQNYFDQNKEIADTVIFDGSSGYLKWRDYCNKSSTILIMEHTDPRLRETIDVYNTRYISDRIEEWNIPNNLDVPCGVSLLGYKERTV